MAHALINPSGRFHVHLLVGEMKRSIDFYVTLLGFYYDHGLPETAWLTRPGVLLTLAPGEPQPLATAYFGFTVASMAELEQAYAKLHRRYGWLSSPPALEDGRPYFFLYDPDGYPIAFTLTELEQAP